MRTTEAIQSHLTLPLTLAIVMPRSRPTVMPMPRSMVMPMPMPVITPSCQTIQAVYLAVARNIPTPHAAFHFHSSVSSFEIPVRPKQPDSTPLFNPPSSIHATHCNPRYLLYYSMRNGPAGASATMYSIHYD
jgi:hypothetical protein